MKKIYFLVIAVWICIVPANAHDIKAIDPHGNETYYNFNNDGKSVYLTYRGTSYDQYENEYSGDVVIPNTVAVSSGIIPVTGIGWNAFTGCSGVTSITIPENITTVSNDFGGCTGLTRFIVSEQNANFSTIDGVLTGKNQTKLVAYPPGKLPAYIIPNSITSIGSWAFGYCSGLTSIFISKNVASIEANSFNLCTGLTGFEVSADNATYSASDGVLYDKNKTIIVRYPPNKANALFVVPATVTEIGGYAFRDCLNLQSFLVSENTAVIGHGAFGWSK